MNLNKPAFNVGVMAFKPNVVIKNNTYTKIKSILRDARAISPYLEQAVLNIYFYGKWIKLPKSYNLQPWVYLTKYKVKLKYLQAIIFHFAGYRPETRPWVKNNLFNDEWQMSFSKFKQINLLKRPNAKQRWSNFQIYKNEIFLIIHRLYYKLFFS